MDRALRYYGFADRFGWGSEQTDNEKAWLLDRYETIADVQAEVREERDRRRDPPDRPGR